MSDSIKFKYTFQQYTTLCDLLSNSQYTEIESNNHLLLAMFKLLKFSIERTGIKMQKKLLEPKKKKYSLNLKPEEALPIYIVFNHHMDSLPIYERAIVRELCEDIHKNFL